MDKGRKRSESRETSNGTGLGLSYGRCHAAINRKEFSEELGMAPSF